MLEQAFYEQDNLWRAERWLQGHQLQRLTACVEMLPSDLRSLLDVGAGNGAFLSLVESRVSPTLALAGVERAAAAIDAGVCRSPLLFGSSDALPHTDRAFDLVSALELIEHLPWQVYERTLTELGRVADRFVLVNVPYRERRLHVHCPYCGCCFNPYFHMRVFRDADLQSLLPGFRLQGVRHIQSRENLLRALTLPFRKRVFGGFPPTAMCPQCGYRSPRADGSVVAAAPTSTAGWLVRTLTRTVPSVLVTTEVVALYRRLV